MIYEKKQIDTLVEKMKAMNEPYMELLFEKILEPVYEKFETDEHYRDIPENVIWQDFKKGDQWGHDGTTMWIRTKFVVPKEFAGRKIVLLSDSGAHESLVFINGKPSGLFNYDAPFKYGHHSIALVKKEAVIGETIDVALESFVGTPNLQGQPYSYYSDESQIEAMKRKIHTFQSVGVYAIREEVSDFIYDLRTLIQLVENLDEKSMQRGKAVMALIKVFEHIYQYPKVEDIDVWMPAMIKAHKPITEIISRKSNDMDGRIGIIGHSHMDTAWMWPIEETIRKCARTYINATTFMDWYDEYMFVQSSALHSYWMKEYYPHIFEQIKKRVAEGRYEPNGGVWVECDCNITGGESMIRQFLWGQKFTSKEFGYKSDAFWLPDTFGYSAAIPQIMKGCDIKYFLTTKIEWNDTNDFPYKSFVWQGIDGSEVLVHFNRMEAWPDVNTAINDYKELTDKHVVDERLISYGFGDGGGGPQYQMIEMAKRVKDLEGCPKCEYTTVSAFMDKMNEKRDDLPLWVGELYFELHRGTLTMLHNIKRSNRLAEITLREYEILAVKTMLNNKKFDKEKLRHWWSIVLTNQFHDILPGTSIPEVYEKAVPENYTVVDETREQSKKLLTSMSEDDNYVSIYNSLSWDRNSQIELDGFLNIDEVTSQHITGVDSKNKTVIMASLPALGSISYKLVNDETESNSPFKYTNNTLDTPFLKVEFDENGAITSLYNKQAKRQIRKKNSIPLNTFYMGEDVPHKHDNWDIDADIFIKLKPDMRLVSQKVVSDGALQFRIENNYKIGSCSAIKQHMIFYSNSPMVDFETLVDWHDKHKLLKVGFDVDVLSETIKSEMQFGYVQRPTHRNTSWDAAKFEICNHKWSDISETRFGIALLNDCKYGLSCEGSDIKLTLIKSSLRPDDSGDEGLHYLRYALLPHDGSFLSENVIKPSYEYNTYPTLAMNKAKSNESMMNISASNIIVEAIKPLEDGNGFAIRLYECEKTRTDDVKISFGFNTDNVYIANMLEDIKERLDCVNNSIKLDFTPFEIKTVIVML